MRLFAFILVSGLLVNSGFAQTLALPAREKPTSNGCKLVQSISSLKLSQREAKIVFEILSGNVPKFLRQFCPVSITNVANRKTNSATFLVAPDYLSIGSDDNYLLIPLTPFSAQKIADGLDCVLPTRKMVNHIYSNAVVKLTPSSIPPSSAMTTVPVFMQHNEIVRRQRFASITNFPWGALTAGHKKDVVISAKLAANPGKVAIYGWHQTNGIPIQPLYLGHTASWVDYSHGIRLVHKNLIVNKTRMTVAEVLADPELAGLLSDEGIILKPQYKQNSGFLSDPDEEITILQLTNDVRILINSPSTKRFAKQKPTKLIFYGLPNGNTIEQTIGKKTVPGDDWHFDIQHIGAQTRFLREKLPDENIVVVYLENGLKSWPAWRRKFGDQQIPQIISSIKSRFKNTDLKIVLTGHSGGGSFTFGYLNCVETIPNEIRRIAFLDSNYAYETALHRDKLTDWLQSSNEPFLTVIAYHDNIALLDGKTFVSAGGGTWGKSHAMKGDLETRFQFKEDISPEFQNYFALDGRLQFLLKKNPEKKIFHTVQVERNGFIHAMLTGTSFENDGYKYFGERAYTQWISRE